MVTWGFQMPALDWGQRRRQQRPENPSPRAAGVPHRPPDAPALLFLPARALAIHTHTQSRPAREAAVGSSGKALEPTGSYGPHFTHGHQKAQEKQAPACAVSSRPMGHLSRPLESTLPPSRPPLVLRPAPREGLGSPHTPHRELPTPAGPAPSGPQRPSGSAPRLLIAVTFEKDGPEPQMLGFNLKAAGLSSAPGAAVPSASRAPGAPAEPGLTPGPDIYTGPPLPASLERLPTAQGQHRPSDHGGTHRT